MNKTADLPITCPLCGYVYTKHRQLNLIGETIWREDRPNDLVVCSQCKRLLVYRGRNIYEEATEGDISRQSIPPTVVADALRRVWAGEYDAVIEAEVAS